MKKKKNKNYNSKLDIYKYNCLDISYNIYSNFCKKKRK